MTRPLEEDKGSHCGWCVNDENGFLRKWRLSHGEEERQLRFVTTGEATTFVCMRSGGGGGGEKEAGKCPAGGKCDVVGGCGTTRGTCSPLSPLLRETSKPAHAYISKKKRSTGSLAFFSASSHLWRDDDRVTCFSCLRKRAFDKELSHFPWGKMSLSYYNGWAICLINSAVVARSVGV